MTMSEPRFPDVYVQLTGEDGNAWFIMGRVRGALKAAGVPEETISEFTQEATSQKSYDDFLSTVMRWVDAG